MYEAHEAHLAHKAHPAHYAHMQHIIDIQPNLCMTYSEPSVQGISRDLPFFSHRAEIP